LFSFLRPEHETMIRKALADLPVSMSHDVLDEFREYERASTTVLDAYVKPLVTRYLADLKATTKRDFFVMKSGGGVVSQDEVSRRPIDMVLSGPAGGVAAAAALSRGGDRKNLVTFDMGGTSADFSALPGGEAIVGVQRVVRASMAKAMRLVLARRGLDPKEYALLAFGGAGPMHAWALARELGVRAVLVPFLPGAFSAYGILISPIRVEYS